MAFYDDMADVATDLLTEFGLSLTFERITKTFNKITGKDSARTTATSTTVGVEVPINNRLVDGTRIQSGDRFFVIDSSYVPAMGDRLQDSPYVPCAYPLDATLAELIAFGIPAKLTASESDQKGTHVLSGGAVSISKGMSVAGGQATASPIALDEGRKAIRFILTLPALTDGGLYSDVGVIVGGSIYSTTPAVIAQVIGESRKNGQFQFRFVLGATTVLTLDNLASGTITADILFDATTGTVSLWVGNVAKVLSANTYTPASAFPVFSVTEVTTVAGNAGLVSAVQLVTSSITGTTFPYGTTDQCGNQIGYPEVSPSWSVIAIDPIKPADTVVAYKLQVRK